MGVRRPLSLLAVAVLMIQPASIVLADADEIVTRAAVVQDVPYGVSAVHAADLCGTEHPDIVAERFQAAIQRGEILDPSARAAKRVRPRKNLPVGGGTSTLTTNDVFIYEDSDDLLVSNFTDDELFLFMGDATTALIDKHGDNFDFVGFFINFQADHQLGAAFYLGLENLVDGIGLNNFIRRALWGVPGDQVEGWVMMWNVNSWSGGIGPGTGFTRLVLGQEFEHRWGMFLDPIVGGRPLQGNDGSCGRFGHWNFRVDGQGSGMEIAEWVGEGPAVRVGGSLNFNEDISGVFSPADLYLMGYLSPGEMSSRLSEFRYMNNSNCFGSHNGSILNLNAAIIINANGTRVPTVQDSQKHFRCAWIMVHRPGDFPTNGEMNRMLGILEQHQIDWYNGTLGVGTIDNSIRRTLGGDFDEDGDVDLSDYASFVDCQSTSSEGSMLAGCNVFDDDVDGDVDILDYSAFMRAFNGDCGISVTQQPVDALACVNGVAEFTVETNTPAVSYQWTRDGVPIPGATGQSLTVSSIGQGDLGEYRVSAFGECYVNHSAPATLTVFAAPEIVTPPQDTPTCLGAAATLSVDADGVGPLSYQWQFMGDDIDGAIDSTVDLTDVDETLLGSYRCVITDGCGVDVATSDVSLSLADPVSIVTQPVGGDVCEGENIILIASASGLSTFEWFRDGELLDGFTSPFLFIASATVADSGAYVVRANGTCDSADSELAVVNVVSCDGGP
jgi:hypothetical protein